MRFINEGLVILLLAVCAHWSRGDVKAMLNAIRRFIREEEGASAAEYALLLVVITLGMVGAVQLLGGNIATAINNAAAVFVGS